MHPRHLTLALAFFCGVRAQAQMPDSTRDTTRSAATPQVVRDSAREDRDDEEPPVVASTSRGPLRLVPINLGIAPGTATNGTDPQNVRNWVSLDLVAGEAGEIRGLQGSVGMNEVHHDVRGVQLAGGLNRVADSVVGFQAAAVNLVGGDVRGYQGAYFLNRVEGNVVGYQGSTFGNLVKGSVTGVQASSFYGKARSVRGVQFNAVGVTDTLRGLQWGVVNWSGNTKGVQFGLVNISRTGEAAQIGLVNVQPNTRFFAETWVDETRSAHVALNYGSPHWYSLVELLASHREPEGGGFGLGFGFRSASPKTILSIDQSALVLAGADPSAACEEDQERSMDDQNHDDGRDSFRNCALNMQLRTRLTLGRHLLGRFAIFGGVSYNVLFTPDETNGERLLEPENSYHWDPNPNVRLWPGVFVGLRI